jgi:hypothetical protein
MIYCAFVRVERSLTMIRYVVYESDVMNVRRPTRTGIRAEQPHARIPYGRRSKLEALDGPIVRGHVDDVTIACRTRHGAGTDIACAQHGHKIDSALSIDSSA